MDELRDNRFFIKKYQAQDILFDIQTGRVYGIGDPAGVSLSKLAEMIIANDPDCNHLTLEKIGYEDGSNLAININLTPACNLKCVYCFAQGGDYGGMNKTMNESIIGELEFLISQYQTKSKKIRFEFFGGEPLLNFKTIQGILNFSQEYSKRTNLKFIHRISTNLTFVDDEIIDALGRNDFIVSISIDGNRKVQDSLRPFKNGDGSYDTILENTRKIREKYPDLIIVARMTIAQKEYPLIENIKDLLKTGYFDYISIYPASVKNEKDGSGGYHYYFDNEIKTQVQEVIDSYASLFALSGRFKGILEYEKIYDEILNGKLSISHCAAGGTYFTISGDRTIVPCHRVCGKEQFLLNKESRELDRSIIREWSGKVDHHPVCGQCWARYICGGGCKQEHLSATGSIKDINTNSCEYHMFVIERLLEKMTEFSAEFNARKITVDDLFVYCGRPVAANGRNVNLDYLKGIQGLKVFGASKADNL